MFLDDAGRDVLAAQAAGMKGFVALFRYIPANERDHPNGLQVPGLKSSQAMAKLPESLGL